MALLTHLDSAQAARLASEYGLEVTLVEPIAKGSVNSNFFLVTRSGRYFLRIFEEQTEEGAEYETALLTHLAARGVPTPAPLPNLEGRWATRTGDKHAALFPFVAGEELCQARVDPCAAHQIGRALALVHIAGASFPIRRLGRFDASDLLARLSRIDRSVALEPPDLLASLRAELNRSLPTLAGGVIHGDLFRDNVLWSGGRIEALLDFESAADGPWAYDLAVTLLAWTFTDRFEPELVAAMLEGYGSQRALEREEWTAFASLARRAAARFIVTRITDFLLRRLERGETGVFKDYRRFVARWNAIDVELLPLIETHRG